MADAGFKSVFGSVPETFDVMLIKENSRTMATRLSENAIQANTAVDDIDIWLRVFRDNRIGLAHGTSEDSASLQQLAEKAVGSWKTNPVNSALKIPRELTLPFQPVNDSAVVNEKPAFRVDKLANAVRVAGRHGLTFSGAYTTTAITRELATRSGLHVVVPATSVDVSCTISHPESATGWARAFSSSESGVDPVSLAVRAGGKALNSRRKTKLTQGKYTVVLEPAAVGSMLLFLAFLSFGGRVYNRGTSFMSENKGQKVLPGNFTIADEPSDRLSQGWPFDYEGIPAQDVVLIENGVARGVVHDTGTAEQAATRSTGHALTPGNTFGPYPRNLKMAAGSAGVKQLLKDAGHSVLVSRLWYINYVNPMQTMITGSTRDGTFLLKNGTIQTAVHDMRFEESILQAFRRSVLLSKEREYVRQFGSTLCVPWMVIPDFNFTEVI